MDIKKMKIQEIIDSDDNIIGTEDLPQNDKNAESQASNTTDHNVQSHGQNFKNDFLGRFGFYFYESKNKNKEIPQVLKDIATIVGTENAHKVMKVIKPHLEKTIDEIEGGVVNEGKKVAEDKLLDKKADNTIVKKENKKEELQKKIEKVADLLAKLPKNSLDKLMDLLEKRKV